MWWQTNKLLNRWRSYNPPHDATEQQQEDIPVQQDVSNNIRNSDIAPFNAEVFYTPPPSPNKQGQQSTPTQHNISTEQIIGTTQCTQQQNNTASNYDTTTGVNINYSTLDDTAAYTNDNTSSVTGTQLIRHDNVAVDKVAAELNNLSPYKPRIQDSEKFKEEGNKASDAQQYDKAMELYSLSLDANPSNIATLNNKSRVYSKLKQWDNVISNSTSCLEKKPHDIYALCLRGRAYKMVGNFEAAVADFELAIEKANPTEPQRQTCLQEVNNCKKALQLNKPRSPLKSPQPKQPEKKLKTSNTANPTSSTANTNMDTNMNACNNAIASNEVEVVQNIPVVCRMEPMSDLFTTSDVSIAACMNNNDLHSNDLKVGGFNIDTAPSCGPNCRCNECDALQRFNAARHDTESQAEFGNMIFKLEDPYEAVRPNANDSSRAYRGTRGRSNTNEAGAINERRSSQITNDINNYAAPDDANISHVNPTMPHRAIVEGERKTPKEDMPTLGTDQFGDETTLQELDVTRFITEESKANV